MPREKDKLKYFKHNQKKIIKLIIKKDYKTLIKKKSLYYCGFWRGLRRHFVQIRWNQHEKFVRVFGKKIAEKEV